MSIFRRSFFDVFRFDISIIILYLYHIILKPKKMTQIDKKATYAAVGFVALILILSFALMSLAGDVNVVSVYDKIPSHGNVSKEKGDIIKYVPWALVVASEAMPFLPNKAQGVLHAIIRAVKSFFIRK